MSASVNSGSTIVVVSNGVNSIPGVSIIFTVDALLFLPFLIGVKIIVIYYLATDVSET